VALSSEAPVKLAERCTVFMESDLVAYHQKGVERKDSLRASLRDCPQLPQSVVENEKLEQRIMFLVGFSKPGRGGRL